LNENLLKKMSDSDHLLSHQQHEIIVTSHDKIISNINIPDIITDKNYRIYIKCSTCQYQKRFLIFYYITSIFNPLSRCSRDPKMNQELYHILIKKTHERCKKCQN